MSSLARPARRTFTLPAAIISAALALIVGALLGIALTLGAVGLLSFAVGGTLTCTVNNDGTITSCANGSGQQVKVPHHIQIRR